MAAALEEIAVEIAAIGSNVDGIFNFNNKDSAFRM